MAHPTDPSNTSNLRVLIPTIVLAFVPSAMVATLTVSEPIVAIAGAIWFVTAVLYCLRVRKRSALWIFILLPVAFAPFVYELLIIAGVLLGRGEF
jgi:hypothetical protein